MDEKAWRQTVAQKTATKAEASEIWTVHDVAGYLRMSEAKVYRLVREQQLPVIRIGKTWRFRKDLLDAWLSQSAASSLKGNGQET